MNSSNSTKIKLLSLVILMVIVWVSIRLFNVSSFFANHFSSVDKQKQPPPLAKFTDKNTGVVTLWFDDGWKSQYNTAFPITQRFQYPAAIAVSINYVGLPAFMTWQQLDTLQASGWEITSHSITHNCDLRYYNPKTIEYELKESQNILKNRGFRAEHFVMPCGYTRSQIKRYFVDKHPPIVETSKRYYSSFRTTADQRINPLPIKDLYRLNAFQIRHQTTDKQIDTMIQLAKKQKGWLIIVFHQIDDSKRAFSVSAERFEAILEKIKQAKLPVVLPSQIIPPRSEN